MLTGKHAGVFECNSRVESGDCEAFLQGCIESGYGGDVAALIVDARDRNLAAKPDVLIVACAMVAATDPSSQGRAEAWCAFDKIVWTGTQLFMFVHHYHRKWKGSWGRVARSRVAGWYSSKTPGALAKQVTKYASRVIDGNRWTHKDVLRLCHYKPDARVDAVRHLVVGYAHCGRDARRCLDAGDAEGDQTSYGFLRAVEHVATVTDEAAVVSMIETYGLQKEHLPSERLTSPEVWRALVVRMQPMAVLRNLGRISSLGLLTDPRVRTHVAATLSLPKASILHPYGVFIAKLCYEGGAGRNFSWTPDKFVSVLLSSLFEELLGVPDDADYVNVPHDGRARRVMHAIDVSGSMMFGALAGSTGASLRQAAAGLAHVLSKRSSDECIIAGFAAEITDLPALASAKSLGQVATAINQLEDGQCDLVLMIDLTGSMGQWLKAAVQYLAEVVGLARRGFRVPGALRVGLVGYRDFDGCDEQGAPLDAQCSADHFVVIDPTADVDAVVAALRKQIAEGGDDQPEDVAGALDKVRGLAWRPDARRLIVHILDAPPHGEQYQDASIASLVHDNFPDGDPYQRDPVEILRGLAAGGCDYVMVNCRSDHANLATTERVLRKAFEGTPGRMEYVHAAGQTGRFSRLMMDAMERSFFGKGTDTSCVIRQARTDGTVLDCFVVYTDDPSEHLHALHDELLRYRAEVAPARLVVLALAGMDPTLRRERSRVAETCPHTLLIDGFSPDMVSVIDTFVRGEC